MIQISQRTLNTLLRTLKEDFPEDMRHFNDTGDDEDLIWKDIDAVISVLENANPSPPATHCRSCSDCKPDGTRHEARIDLGSNRRFKPNDGDYLPTRVGQIVRVDEELPSAYGGRRYRVCFYKTDGYVTDAYEDELEEV